MIENVVSVDDLRSLARSNRTSNEFQSIPKRRLDEVVEQGWKIAKENKTSFRMVREKSKPNLLEDRVWSMLYKMGFTHFSGKGGAHLAVDARNPDGPKNQIDVVGLDSEVALAIECKTTTEENKYLSKDDVEQLKKFADIFGAEPWIAIKFKGCEWYFISLEDIAKTSKNFIINIDTAKNNGLLFEEIINK